MPINSKLRGTWVTRSVRHLPSARVIVLGCWDQAPHRAPCSAGSLLLPLLLPTTPCLCSSLSNKQMKSFKIFKAQDKWLNALQSTSYQHQHKRNRKMQTEFILYFQIEFIIKNLLTRQSRAQMAFTHKFYQNCKRNTNISFTPNSENIEGDAI